VTVISSSQKNPFLTRQKRGTGLSTNSFFLSNDQNIQALVFEAFVSQMSAQGAQEQESLFINSVPPSLFMNL